MIWFLQSSFWAYLLILGLPLWRHVDLLPIVAHEPGRHTADDAEAAGEEQAVEDMLDARRAGAPGDPARQ